MVGGLDKLTRLAVLHDDTAAAIDAEVDRLHREGTDYGKMAAALGVSRQAVRQRHVRYQARQERPPGPASPAPGRPTGGMPSLAQIRSYLSRTGWERRTFGDRGAAWFLGGQNGIAIPTGDWDELNVMAVIEHIAAVEGRRELQVLRAINREKGR